MIAIFYHLYQTNHWEKLFEEQINSLITSGLYSACNFVHVGINGNEKLPFTLYKMTIQYNQNKILEANTLQSLWEFANANPNYKILYFHSKGVTYNEEHNLAKSVNYWRKYLEYYVIEKWQDCIKDLEYYDCVGAEWCNESNLFDQGANKYIENINPHYSGNFWWANASYINKLDTNDLYSKNDTHERWKSEFWIGTKNPNFKSYHNSKTKTGTLYKDSYLPQFYRDDIQYLQEKIMKKDINMQNNMCLISMFKNESKGILRMLESVWKHIDFYIFQDNGSTDGTPELVVNFFKDKNIPGYIYNLEEGFVSFGYNRDHLLQTCLKTDHGCDWILKMDCDEYLEVDDDFDWSIFFDTSIQSFHVPAISGDTIYNRAWIWNAKLPWKFKHDIAHECIYIDDDLTGENFQRYDLPKSFRMINTNDGESYTVPTKYLSDALKLEEKMIREQTMLSDSYHFWYIGKSYFDSLNSNAFPLGDSQKIEFCKRAIFYLTEYTKNFPQSPEMVYFSYILIGHCYRFMKIYDEAISYYNKCNDFTFDRNEHIKALAEIYWEMRQYQNMYQHTCLLLSKNRTNPFPQCTFFIDKSAYYDTSEYPRELHDISLTNRKEEPPSFYGIRHLFDKSLSLKGIEIGCLFGDNTEYMLNYFPNLHLVGIDPYTDYIDWNHSLNNRNLDLEQLALAVEKFKDRFVLFKATSDTIHPVLGNNSFDFVFIDGLHTFDQVLKDCENYYPKVKSGGIIAGHDYDMITEVKNAVDLFAQQNNITQIEKTSRDVWYWVKP